MRTRLLLSLLAVFFAFNNSDAATARRTTGAAKPAQTQTAGRAPTAARAATNVRTVPRAGTATTSGTKTTSARSAKPTTGTTASQPKTISARAGTTQKVINTGTKVSNATKNTIVDETCQEKYNGCMDAFCMIENSNGGRCNCSDRINDLNKALAEIEKIDEQSYRMATMGIEQLEMGADADAAIAMAQNVTDQIANPQKKQSGNLSFSAFDAPIDFNANVFQSSNSTAIEDKTGNALYTAVSDLCKQQIPECASSIQTLQLLYGQQIKSDCLAYENTLKKKRSQSNEKLQAAERALRETALEQHQAANKYDLSKCTLKFKECMQTTGGCGEDFSGCASVVATDNTSARNANMNKTQKYKIQGAVSSIEIAASTYDTLMAKKPLCESVTKQCTSVASQVWDTFLREVAPQIKSAEIIAEDNARQNCISNISSCFQKACKDTIDPNDPDGSYDMCLTRPETMFNVCRITLNACGIDATKASTAEKSPVWKHVKSVLAAMRVDACTTQVKECLQANDRCGADYSNCIGLDQTAIMGLCPLDKVVACNSSEYGDNVSQIEQYIYNVAQGVFLSIDNSLMQACQNAVTAKMTEICGDTNSCFLADANTDLGVGSLQTTQDDDSNYIITGTLDFNGFKLKQDEEPTAEKYQNGEVYTVLYEPESSSAVSGGDIDPAMKTLAKKRVNNVVLDFQNELNRKISLLANDPTINMCITGRDISQIVKGRERTERTDARFPNLITPYIDTIYDSLLSTLKSNYTQAYANEVSKANSLSQEYRNMLMCYGITDLSTAGADANGRRTNTFPKAVETRYGFIGQGPYHVKLSGVSNDTIMRLQASGTNDTRVHYDNSNPKTPIMIATEDISAVYEPGPQTCRITSRLYACTGYEAIYEGQSKSTSVGLSGGVSASYSAVSVGANGGIDVGTSSSDTTFSGTYCNSFAEPLISEQIISFRDGEAMFGDVSRSNMQNQTNISTNVSTINDNSWSFALEADLSLDNSRTTNVDGDVENIDMGDDVTNNYNGKTVQKASDCTEFQNFNPRTNKCVKKPNKELDEICAKEGGKVYSNQTHGCVEKGKTNAQQKKEEKEKAKAECDKKKDTHEWKAGKCVAKKPTRKQQQANAAQQGATASNQGQKNLGTPPDSNKQSTTTVTQEPSFAAQSEEYLQKSRQDSGLGLGPKTF